jgi:hypothetical protein
MCVKPLKTKKAETRTCKIQQVGATRILWITSGGNTTAYRLEAIKSEIGGRGFRLTKAIQGDGAAEVYDVLLDGKHSTCECRGFSRYGMSAANGRGCKHVAGLAALLARGQLY